jgi:hypothetical protein
MRRWGARTFPAVATALAATAVSAPIAATARPVATYQVASLAATIRDAQVTHEGPGEDGEGASNVRLSSLNRPRGTLPSARRALTLKIRVTGSRDAHATFLFVDRVTGTARSTECASTLDVARTAPLALTLSLDGRSLHLRLRLPYVRAPFVETGDLYPPTGPCDAATGATVRTLQLGRVLPRSKFTRSRFTITFVGTRRAVSGDTTYTTTWHVTLTLHRV